MSYGMEVTSNNGYTLIDPTYPHFTNTEVAYTGNNAGQLRDIYQYDLYNPISSVAILAYNNFVGNIRYKYVNDDTDSKKIVSFSTVWSDQQGKCVSYRLDPNEESVPNGDYGLKIWNEDQEVVYNSGSHPMNVIDIIEPPEVQLTWSDLGNYNNFSGLTGAGWINYSGVIRSIMPTNVSSRRWWYAVAYPLPAGANAVLAGWGGNALTYADQPIGGNIGSDNSWNYKQKIKQTYVGVHNGYFVVLCYMPENHWYHPLFFDPTFDTTDVWTRCMLNYYGKIVACKV